MAIFAGKQWFRDNLQPYLTVIKGELCKHPPVVHSTQPIHVVTGTVNHVILKGDYFHPNLTVYLPFVNGTITNVVWNNFHEIEFDIFVGTDSTVTPTITTCDGTATFDVLAVTSTWVDLRAGSPSTWTETHDPGTTITYDSEGLISTGSLWGNWYKFTSHSWARTTLKKVEFIMKHNNTAHMAGIMGSEQDETSNAQYYQAEIYAYFPNTFWGFYGTNVSHSGVNGSQAGAPALTDPYYKFVFENNGQPGSNYYLYGLADLSNFDDTSNLMMSGTVPASFTCDSPTLYVAATTANNTQRMVAFNITDM
jgi:hypothetical protein